MNKIESKKIREQMLTVTHKSGLPILLIPKPGFSKTYAVFATKFGSIDRHFVVDGRELTVPDGIAHFLEHKLFDNKDGNAFELYAKTGASANAYTSFDKTAYLFSCTEKFEESLDILLNFVTHPYFTKESVDKEQGIIGQEIKMYDDDGDWRVQFNLLKAMYEKNPVGIDIAGTVESISQITDQTLYDCYNTFYNLNNMVLCVVGDVQLDTILKCCDKNLEEAKKLQVERLTEQDEKPIVTDYIEQKLPVAVPMFQIGFKDEGGELTGKALVKREAMANILLEMIAGRGTDFYEMEYQKNVLNTTFDTEYMVGRGHAVAILGGESSEPMTVKKDLLEELGRFAEQDNRKVFERSRRAVYSHVVRLFNSVDHLANGMVGYYFADSSMFEAVEIYDEITYEETMELFRQMFDRKKMVLSVIKPLDEE